jgi:hypothetical protein
MTDSEIKLYDEFIQQHNLVAKTGMSLEGVRREVKRAMVACSFAHILNDVVNSFIMDCDVALGHFGKCFSQKDKATFNQLHRHIKAADHLSREFAVGMYNSVQSSLLCSDSDWWYNMIKLIDNRLESQKDETYQLLDFLFSLPEHDNTYKVTLNDLKTFEP